MDVAALLRCLPTSCAAAQTGKPIAGIGDHNAMHNKLNRSCPLRHAAAAQAACRSRSRL